MLNFKIFDKESVSLQNLPGDYPKLVYVDLGTDENQIAKASALLDKLFGWIDLSDARWACLRINRAEGREEGRHRPDQAFLKSEAEFLIAWPTKFTLSPALADAVAQELVNQHIQPSLSSEPIPELTSREMK